MKKWQPPENVTVRIVCAANKTKDGLIIAGARHWDDIMREVALRVYPGDRSVFGTDTEQGFIDQWDRFYTREEAMKAIQVSGQPIDVEGNMHYTTQLFSEGLY